MMISTLFFSHLAFMGVMTVLLFIFIYLSFCLFRAAPTAYGGSQARGPMLDLSLVCDLHHKSGQHQILNPLSRDRDQIFNLMVPDQIHFCCAIMGTLNVNGL